VAAEADGFAASPRLALQAERHARGLAIAALLLAAAYAGALWALDALPYQDVPNHLARAVAIADLLFDGGREYGAHFTFEWQFVPYILGDAWHVLTVRWLAPETAARLWVIVSYAAFPAAAWLLLREWGATLAARAAGTAIAVYLAADWFLRLGFLNFRYGLALTLLAAVAWERAVRAPTPVRVLVYAIAVLACYLTHLSALLFLIAFVGTLSLLAWLRERRFPWRHAALGVPLLLFLGWHMAFRAAAEVGATQQPPVLKKLLRIGGALAPTREPVEIAIALAFLLLTAIPLALRVWRMRREPWPPRALDGLALAVAFTAVYLVLPEIKGAVWGIDIRALPFVWLFGALALVLALSAAAVRRLTVAALAVGVAHLVALATTLSTDNAVMREYRQIAASVPPGANVLTVTTRPRRGVVSPTAHAGSYAMLYARAVVPYTFTGNLDAPMPYFNFRERPPPFPWQWWYLNRDPVRPAPWLLAGYDYLLVQQPVDWRRVPATIDVVRGNEAVVLARVRQSSEPARRTAEVDARPR
jgi:hypothetical protein